jgi:hypothetical protein
MIRYRLSASRDPFVSEATADRLRLYGFANVQEGTECIIFSAMADLWTVQRQLHAALGYLPSLSSLTVLRRIPEESNNATS